MIALCEVLRQRRARCVEDDTRGVGTQTMLDDWNGYRIEMVTKRLVHLEQHAVAGREKLGYTELIDEHLDTLGKLAVVTDLRALIEHLDEELLVARLLDHRGIHVLLPALCGGNTCLAGGIELHQPCLHFFYSWFIHSNSCLGGLIINVQKNVQKRVRLSSNAVFPIQQSDSFPKRSTQCRTKHDGPVAMKL